MQSVWKKAVGSPAGCIRQVAVSPHLSTLELPAYAWFFMAPSHDSRSLGQSSRSFAKMIASTATLASESSPLGQRELLRAGVQTIQSMGFHLSKTVLQCPPLRDMSLKRSTIWAAVTELEPSCHTTWRCFGVSRCINSLVSILQ